MTSLVVLIATVVVVAPAPFARAGNYCDAPNGHNHAVTGGPLGTGVVVGMPEDSFPIGWGVYACAGDDAVGVDVDLHAGSNPVVGVYECHNSTCSAALLLAP